MDSQTSAKETFEEIEKHTFERIIPFQQVLQVAEVEHRYSDIVCPKETAVAVDGQYLHANRVTTADGEITICTQAPASPETQELFLKTCLEYGNVILDLTNLNDNVEPYFPTDIGEVYNQGSMTSECLERRLIDNHTTLYRYRLEDREKKRAKTVLRIHFEGWQDHGAISVKDLRELVDQVDNAQEQITPKQPLIIHCRSGVGRTGTFVTARTLKHLAQSKTLQPNQLIPTIKSIVLKGRQERGPRFVCQESQLQLLIEYGEELLQGAARERKIWEKAILVPPVLPTQPVRLVNRDISILKTEGHFVQSVREAALEAKNHPGQFYLWPTKDPNIFKLWISLPGKTNRIIDLKGEKNILAKCHELTASKHQIDHLAQEGFVASSKAEAIRKLAIDASKEYLIWPNTDGSYGFLKNEPNEALNIENVQTIPSGAELFKTIDEFLAK